MTWHPPRDPPTPSDYHDASPPILDWVSGNWRSLPRRKSVLWRGVDAPLPCPA
jgi:hypothetical protein